MRAAIGLLLVAAHTSSCGSGDTNPTPVVSIGVSSTTPAPGTTLTPTATNPGFFFVRGSGQFGVTVTISASRDLPFAQLMVFLLINGSADKYCGQNLPDWPVWRPFPGGQLLTYTVTGFQVFGVPCDVTGIRAIFHTRDDLHLLGIPAANFILADATLPVVHHLRASQ